jgi:hypothetical protein
MVCKQSISNSRNNKTKKLGDLMEFTLTLNGAQTEVLLVHLSVMRKNIRSVLKRNYGVFQGKRHLKVYDRIKERLEAKIELLTKDKHYPFLFSEEEVILLHSFLQVFFSKIKEEMDSKIKGSVDQEKVKENMQLALLEEVQEKVNGLVGVKVG